MKIVHLSFCGIVTDGWTYQDNLLTKYHKKLGHDVTMITTNWVFDNKGNIKKVLPTTYINNDGVKIIRLKCTNSKFKRIRGIIDYLRNEKPDVIFIHALQFLDLRQIIRYKKLNRGVKIYIDQHGDFANSATNWLSRNILHKIIWKHNAKIIEPYVEKFWAITPDCKKMLIKLYKIPENKIGYLFLGADIPICNNDKQQIIRNRIRNKYKINSDDIVIITGGKIDSKKNMELLLNAIKKIKKKNIKLIVFGTLLPEVKSKIEQKFGEDTRVIFVGWIQGTDIIKYYWSADFAVFPGGQSVVWQQAICAGLPCIFKYHYGIEYLDVGGNCLFLKEDSINELIYKINELFDCNKRAKMAYIAKTKGKEKFSYETIAKKSIEEV